MTKVEELRDIIDAINDQCEKDLPYQTGLMFDVDSLIAAVRAEGVAAERERILSECSCIAADDRSLHQSGREFVAGELWYYFPASVLAPAPKEGK